MTLEHARSLQISRRVAVVPVPETQLKVGRRTVVRVVESGDSARGAVMAGAPCTAPSGSGPAPLDASTDASPGVPPPSVPGGGGGGNPPSVPWPPPSVDSSQPAGDVH